MKKLTTFLLSFLFCASGAIAEDRSLARWDRGVWHVALTENVQWNQRSCVVWTGGDGAGTFSVHVGEGGGDASVSYIPVSYRGMPSALDTADSAAMLIDGRATWLGYEMELGGLPNDWGSYNPDAGLSNHLVAETVQELRAGNMLQMGGVQNGHTQIYDEFGLTGFTATWLKASEWCRFNPNKTFQSS